MLIQLTNDIICNLEESSNNDIKESLNNIAIIFAAAPIKFPLLAKLLKEVADTHGVVKVQIGVNPTLVSGAQWEVNNFTIAIDSARFKQDKLLDIIIFELCNAVNQYLLVILLYIKNINSAEQYAFFYEIAESFSGQRYHKIIIEFLEVLTISENKIISNEQIAEELLKVKKKQIKNDTFSMSVWHKRNKRKSNEIIPHASIYINQFLCNKYYSDLLDNITIEIIINLMKDNFNQSKFKYYQNLIFKIKQDLDNLGLNDKLNNIYIDNMHIFKIFKILDNDHLKYLFTEVREKFQDFAPQYLFLLNIMEVFVTIIEQRQYENDFAFFDSRAEKFLIKILFAIVLEMNQENDLYDVMLKYHSTLQSIKRDEQQLAKKYEISLYGYNLKLLKKDKADQLTIEDCDQIRFQTICNTYTYLKSFATQRQEFLLNSKQSDNIEQTKSSKTPLAICWKFKPTIKL